MRALIERDQARPVPSAVRELAKTAVETLAARNVQAILYYGSCFRDGEVDGKIDGLIDLYLLVDDYASVHDAAWKRFLNRMFPPNVYYVQCRHGGETVRGKVAVMTLNQLERLVGDGTSNPYFWARFAQPTGVVEVAPEAHDRLVGVFVTSIRTLHGHARALMAPPATPEARWTAVLRATYSTELRVEKPGRASQIYHSDRARFDTIDDVLSSRPPGPSAPSWRRRRIEGKLLSVARLIKAAFTFTGGADYLAWKIERHSGVALELADWQRRHPIIAAGPILWRLWRAKVIG